jgi:hypothetical protein
MGILHCVTAMFFDPAYQHTDLNVVLALSTFSHGIIWSFYWGFSSSQVVLILSSMVGAIIGGYYILQLLKESFNSIFNTTLCAVSLSVVGISTILVLFDDLTFILKIIGEFANIALLFSPYIAQQLANERQILAPLKFYIYAFGFASFWELANLLQIKDTYVPFIISTASLLGCTQQCLTYARNSFQRTRSSSNQHQR